MSREQTTTGSGHRARAAAHALAALAGLALLLGGPTAPPARADFGFKTLDLTFGDEGGSPATQAGSHPFAWTTALRLNTTGESVETLPDGELKDLRIELPPGLVGTPALLPRCSRVDLLADECPESTVVGSIVLYVRFFEVEGREFPLYNLLPQPGAPAELGFVARGVPVTIAVAIEPEPPYNLVASLTNVSQAVGFYGSVLTLRGAPGGKPLLTLPRSCTGPLATAFEADSWQSPGAWVQSPPVLTHDDSEPPDPLGATGCDKLGFSPALAVRPTATAAHGPSGLDVSLDAPDEGLTSATGIAHADLRKAALTLPEGMTVNPSVAEGLGACTPAEYAGETLGSAPGAGCPDASRIGTAEVESPLLEEAVAGSLFVAQADDPATAEPGSENPFDSLLAIYAVFESPKLGVLVKQAIEVEPDPKSGRLTATVDDVPQLPFSHLELHLRDGARSPLTAPPSCGTHSTSYELTPSSGGAPLQGRSGFTLDRGCAAPGFAPTLSAGAVDPRAGAASPFVLDLASASGEQNLSALSLALPPGLSADFAATPLCPAALAASGACPQDSRVGYARIAAGAGTTPAWIPAAGEPPASVHLAGPYRGAPFSLVAVVPARAGPFDLGTVAVRAAVDIDPVTAQATVRLDPLPQILGGIPIEYRTLRIVLDRPGFILNPTSCEAMTVRGAAGSAAGARAPLADRFQVGDCAALGFGPRFELRFGGGVGRNGHPAVTASVRPRRGDARLRSASFLLPRGEHLDPARIAGVCPRADFAAGECPADSVYGHVTAWSPLLDGPLRGPVYLRESDRALPDLAADLAGQVHLVLSGHLDTPHARVRAGFDRLPDAPFSRLELALRGGRRGLLVNSEGLCRRRPRATAGFVAQSGKREELHPRLRIAPPSCAPAPSS